MKLRFHVLAGLVLLGLAGPRANAADDYPTRQIKIIVPFPAGAGPDQVARLIGQRLQDELGQTVVIENRSGALGSLGAQEVARSAPDGYTLLMGTNTTQASNVAMLKNLPYDPARDFAPSSSNSRKTQKPIRTWPPATAPARRRYRMRNCKAGAA